MIPTNPGGSTDVEADRRAAEGDCLCDGPSGRLVPGWREVGIGHGEGCQDVLMREAADEVDAVIHVEPYRQLTKPLDTGPVTNEGVAPTRATTSR